MPWEKEPRLLERLDTPQGRSGLRVELGVQTLDSARGSVCMGVDAGVSLLLGVGISVPLEVCLYGACRCMSG